MPSESGNLIPSIALTLTACGSEACLAKSAELNGLTNKSGPIVLELRSLGITAPMSQYFALCLRTASLHERSRLDAFSMSYNPIGSEGAILIAENLPFTLRQLGMVGCEIGEPGGEALLAWVKQTTQLRLICIEQNNFSAVLKAEFRKAFPGVFI